MALRNLLNLGLRVGIGLSAWTIRPAWGQETAAHFSQVWLQSDPRHNFRSLGLLRKGYRPRFDAVAPRDAEPELLALLERLADSPASRLPRLRALWVLYDTPAPSPELLRYRRRMLENIWSVRYLLTDTATAVDIVSTAPEAYRPLLEYGEPIQLVGFEKRFYLPRLYFRTAVVPVDSFAAFVELLSQPGRLRIFQQVAIEQPRHAGGAELPADAVTPQILAAADGSLEAEVVVPEAGYLVLADPVSPAWRVLLDGLPVVVEIANGFQGAVWLTPGRHRLSFSGLAPEGVAAEQP